MKANVDLSLRCSIRGPVRFAKLLIIAFVFGFGIWAAIAPLTSAAIAPGIFGTEAKRKSVQHLSGGIIGELLVREGDEVEAGALLLRLEDTLARSTYELLEGQYIDLIAERARLTAERNGQKEVQLPNMKVANNERATQALSAQRDLFESRMKAMDGRVAILNQKIEKLDAQIGGYMAQMDSVERRRQIIAKEIKAVSRMVRLGLEREPRLLALQRAAAEIDGLIGELSSSTAQAELRIEETELEIIDLKARTMNQVTGDLRDLAGRISDMEPRLTAALRTLSLTEIRAPVSGSVVALRYHTVGGVITPGQPILDIVPSNAELMIEAKVSPTDIDVVRPGMQAEVRLSAFAMRSTPTVPGRVVHISADRLTDRSGNHYYAVHIEPEFDINDAGDLEDVLNALHPGMPVEVMIVTGKRTVLGYLMQPIADSFAKAFRES